MSVTTNPSPNTTQQHAAAIPETAEANGKRSSQPHVGQLSPLLVWAVVFCDIGTSVYYVPGILYAQVGAVPCITCSGDMSSTGSPVAYPQAVICYCTVNTRLGVSAEGQIVYNASLRTSAKYASVEWRKKRSALCKNQC